MLAMELMMMELMMMELMMMELVLQMLGRPHLRVRVWLGEADGVQADALHPHLARGRWVVGGEHTVQTECTRPAEGAEEPLHRRYTEQPGLGAVISR